MIYVRYNQDKTQPNLCSYKKYYEYAPSQYSYPAGWYYDPTVSPPPTAANEAALEGVKTVQLQIGDKVEWNGKLVEIVYATPKGALIRHQEDADEHYVPISQLKVRLTVGE